MRISSKLRKEREAAQIAADEAAALSAATNESGIPDLSDSVNDTKSEEE